MATGGEGNIFLKALEHTTRALSGNPQVEVVFEEEAPFYIEGPIVLRPVPDGASTRMQLAASVFANQQAFLVRFTYIKELQQALNLPENVLFEYVYPLEVARAEALGNRAFLGAAMAAEAFYEAEFKKRLISTKIPSVAEVLAVALRQKLGIKLSGPEKQYLQQYKDFLTPELRSWLEEAAPHLHAFENQCTAYKDLLHLLGVNFDGKDEPTPPQENAPSQSGPQMGEENASQPEGEKIETESVAKTPQIAYQWEEGQTDEGTEGGMLHASAQKGKSDGPNYKAFNFVYDVVEKAFYGTAEPEKKRLEAKYKHIKASVQPLVRPLARKLQRYLMSQTPISWVLDQEEGVLDAQKLPQIIATGDPLPYKKTIPHRDLDTAITLLLDNSGSMRGRPIETTAVCADVLTQTLERCGVRVEVLGFTTRAWKGGRVRQDWLNAGSPVNPGRLNELRHIIYKDAATPYQVAHSGFAMMLADDLLKENIDGESLLWAYNRLRQRHEGRKIIVVISDGAPVDYATDKNNPANYLSQHLATAVQTIHEQKEVELLAIGVGHDVGQYYKNAVVIESTEELGEILVQKLVALFAQ